MVTSLYNGYQIRIKFQPIVVLFASYSPFSSVFQSDVAGEVIKILREDGGMHNLYLYCQQSRALLNVAILSHLLMNRLIWVM